MNVHYIDHDASRGDVLAALCGTEGSYASDDPDAVTCVECVHLADGTLTECRLTDADVQAMTDAVAEFYDNTVTAGQEHDTMVMQTARRVARSAIGCTIHDLRAIENLYVRNVVNVRADLTAVS